MMVTCKFCGCFDPSKVSVIDRIHSAPLLMNAPMRANISYEEWYCQKCKRNWTENTKVVKEILADKAKSLEKMDLKFFDKEYIALDLNGIKELKPGTVFHHKTLGKCIIGHSAETNELYIAIKNPLMQNILMEDVFKSKDRYPFDTGIKILNKV